MEEGEEQSVRNLPPAAGAGEGSAGPAEPQPREDNEVRRWKSSAKGSLPPLMDLKLSFPRHS